MLAFTRGMATQIILTAFILALFQFNDVVLSKKLAVADTKMTVSSSINACPAPLLNRQLESAISTPNLLVLTHPTSFFDKDLSAKTGITAIELWAKQMSVPSLLLHDDGEQELYYYTNCRPDYALYSKNGAFKTPVNSKNIYVVGGYFHACLTHAIASLLQRQKKEAFEITLVTDGIYVSGTLLQRPNAAYFGNIKNYMEQRNQKYIPLSVIIKSLMQDRYSSEGFDYLKDYLNLSFGQFREHLENYHTTVTVGGKEVFILESNNPNSPELRLHLLTSQEIVSQ